MRKTERSVKGKLSKRILGVVLTAALVLGTVSLPQFTVEVKADSVKTITGLGTGAITNPAEPTGTDAAWSGSYVYYGKYFGNSVKYRVLDKASSDFGGKTTMLLDCNSLLDTMEHGLYSYGATGWTNSEIKSWLNGDDFLGSESDPQGAFTLQERNAIASSTKSDEDWGDGYGCSNLNFTGLSGDKIFLLDAKEATRPSYGYSDTDKSAKNREKTGFDSYWWLRSPHSYDSNLAGMVDDEGAVGGGFVDDSLGVSPAFNVNLSSVIFSSFIPSSESGESAPKAGEPGAEYKLTLKDTALAATPGSISGKGKTVTVPYSVVTGSPTQLSVVMTDGTWSDTTGWSSGAVLKYYGKLNIEDGIGTSGTGTFDLPDGFSLSNGWKAYLVAEQVNGEKETDYAGNPVAFNIPKLDPVCNAPTGLTAAYGQTLVDVALTNPQGNTPGTWAWADDTQSVGDVFSPAMTFKANFTPADTTNYKVVENVDVAVTVGKENAVAATVTANSRTYDGAEKPLVTVTGQASGGEMQYALGTATEATEQYTPSIPSKTNAGTYYVWYMAKGDEDHYDSDAKAVEVKISEAGTPSIAFDTPSMSLKIGDEQSIKVIVVPEDAKITWTSNNKAVATVDEGGKVKAVSEGTATITGKITVDVKDYSAECKVTVENEAPVVTPSVKFDATELSLKNGEEKTIKATVVPEGAKITWTSDKEAVATVDETGKVKAVSEGTATITGKITVDGKDYSAECKVTVIGGQTEYVVVPEDVSDDNISSEILERYGTVTEVKAVIKEAAGVTPEQTGNYELFDAQIFVIENGVPRPATASDITSEGLEATFPYPEGSNKNQVFSGAHMIGEDSGGFKAGDIEHLTFTNEDDGLHARVHGLSPVIITWEEPAPTPTPTDASVTLNLSESYLTQGMEKALKATTKPEGATVTWSSSDNSVAYVDGRGIVTGLKTGTATITATITVEGKEYSASCKVTVVPSGFIPSGSSDGGHTHKFIWVTIEATEDSDGELRYQCETCGEIQTRVPLTAYNVFNKNTTEKIRKAPKDATVRIETNKWISFHKMVMEALAERKDVTLEISFLDGEYKGNRCTVVIPKGTDTTTLVDKNGFTGFLFLGGKFGMKTD